MTPTLTIPGFPVMETGYRISREIRPHYLWGNHLVEYFNPRTGIAGITRTQEIFNLEDTFEGILTTSIGTVYRLNDIIFLTIETDGQVWVAGSFEKQGEI
jgi:hypothetical protein